MSDEPERIWMDMRPEHLKLNRQFVTQGLLAAPPYTEYVRADALAAKDAEIERLRARIAEKDEALGELSQCANWPVFSMDTVARVARKALEGQMTAPECRKCCVEMEPGQALLQTLVGGMLDFPGDPGPVTLSAGGPGKLVSCWKCPKCGRSVSQ